MNKNHLSLTIILFLIGMIALVFLSRMPQSYSHGNLPLSEFSTERALIHIDSIAKAPHYIGSPHHEKVGNYLQKELEKLGLETQIQDGKIHSKWNNLVTTKNIIARIKGTNNSKTLLLLTHYDSAPHSNSYGASDDANGLATILEGLRVFLHNKKDHKNDIIILFSDAEELGLNGAFDFVINHEWAKEVGLVINFEARGTAGPSMMLAETNTGNANLIKGFAAAKTPYPVSNSLMYSVYKMLPNDTDLTAFREKGNIPGFNLAYIDDHFDYHTEQDNIENFSPLSLEHQASYFMPMLDYFSNADLASIETTEERVYFNSIFGFTHYPFSMGAPLFIIAFFFFLGIVFFGLAKRNLNLNLIAKGIFTFLFTLFLVGTITFFGWEIIKNIYPEYQDMLHGFTYNGHSYIVAFVLIALALCFRLYHKITPQDVASYLVWPLFFWLLLNFGVLLYLPGASFLIIPFFCSLFMLGILTFVKKYQGLWMVVLSIPVIAILVPFIELFPVGLGLKVLPGSTLLTSLIFFLLLPLFGYITYKKRWAFLILIVGLGYLVKAHLDSDFKKGSAKPNSLVYYLDGDTNKAYWTTYDTCLDDWTKNYFGDNPQTAALLNNVAIGSKYNTGFSYMVDAPLKAILPPKVYFLQDTIFDNLRHIQLKIESQRTINRLDVFADEHLEILHFRANETQKINQEGNVYLRKGAQLISYYPIKNEPLYLSFAIDPKALLTLSLRESSLDLMTNPLFSVPSRPEWAIPMPFVLNNAILVAKKITKETSEKPLKLEVSEDNTEALESNSITELLP
jgi:hypothetical protein